MKMVSGSFVKEGQSLRARFFKKETKESENGFCVSLLDRSIQDLSQCLKGTDESTLEMDSLVPLTRHDPKDLGLICLVKKRKIRFQILSDLKSNLGFS